MQILSAFSNLLHLLQIFFFIMVKPHHFIKFLLFSIFFPFWHFFILNGVSHACFGDHSLQLVFMLQAWFTKLIIILLKVNINSFLGLHFLFYSNLLNLLFLPFKLLFSPLQFFNSLFLDHFMLSSFSFHVFFSSLLQSTLLFLLLLLNLFVLMFGVFKFLLILHF